MEAASTLQSACQGCGGTVVTVALLAVALALLCWYSVAPFSQLERLGIRHPKPTPFLGNLQFFQQSYSKDLPGAELPFYSHPRFDPKASKDRRRRKYAQGFWEGDRALVKAYGPICGYYMGRRMMIVITDPEAIKQVLKDDFDIFRNRTASCLLPRMMHHSLLFLRDERWKQIRSTLVPTFSSAKLYQIFLTFVFFKKFKQAVTMLKTVGKYKIFLTFVFFKKFKQAVTMLKTVEKYKLCPLINQACDVLETKLKRYADSGQICDIHRYYSGLTMDLVASLAFGRIVDSEKNPEVPLIKHTTMFVDLFTPAKPLLILAVAFPRLTSLFLRFLTNKNQEQVNKFFATLIRDLIAARDQQAEEEKRLDLLQLVLDTRGTSSNVQVEHFDIVNQAHHPTLQEAASPKEDRPSMSDDEILGQAMVFIVAGHETTRSLLSFASYLLAVNPECQEKLLGEVDAIADRQTLPDHETVQRMPYLDMVISEALRMYPPAFRFARECSRDCTVAGYRIPAGAVVEFPIGCIHHNPEYWTEPEKFKPERFTAEAKKNRQPFTYLPFGAGPRCCIGVRLALLQTKIALVRVLQQYRLESCPQTQIPLQLNTLTVVGPKDGIHVKIISR